jgi:PEGA domain
MKTTSTSFKLAAGFALAAFSACASTTTIRSNPSGARVYLNGESVGTTPYTMTDTKIVGSSTSVRLEYPGYETINGNITRSEEFDVGACIGGVFLLVPFLWIMGYKPDHTFELRPASGAPQAAPPAPGGETMPREAHPQS